MPATGMRAISKTMKAFMTQDLYSTSVNYIYVRIDPNLIIIQLPAANITQSATPSIAIMLVLDLCLSSE